MAEARKQKQLNEVSNPCDDNVIADYHMNKIQHFNEEKTYDVHNRNVICIQKLQFVEL